MPVHDWTRVTAGIFHAFHAAWTIHLSEALNGGLLPPDYYALPEQDAGQAGPDVLTLHAGGSNGSRPAANGNGPAVALAPPQARFTATLPAGLVTRSRVVTIRHTSDDRIVAMLELVSPGNKSGQYPFQVFLDKLAAALRHGINLLVIDLFPPTPRDPRGVHCAFWEFLGGGPFAAPPGEPLTLAAYAAAGSPTAFVETIAVGRFLPDMPLILAPGNAVPVPLERTYCAAYNGMPARSKAPLEP